MCSATHLIRRRAQEAVAFPRDQVPSIPRRRRPITQFFNDYSAEANSRQDQPWTDVHLAELKALLADDTIRLIDVRRPEELQQTGKIGNALNVPLSELEEALSLADEHFLHTYRAKKPSKTDNIVFTCLAGVRSRRALLLAQALGYKKARHYVGGWEEWAAQELGQAPK